jgi:hypothetical protein
MNSKDTSEKMWFLHMNLLPNEVSVTRVRIISNSDDLVPEAIWL